MKKVISVMLFAGALCFVNACTSDVKKEQQDKQAVEDQMSKDQAAMDSLERAIQAQINEVDEDSIMKLEH